MRTRDVYLAKQESLSDAQTLIKDLNLTQPIMSITVLYEATNGATSNTVGKLNGDVDKLEVVDGSDVLHSVSGIEEQALNFFHHKQMPYQELNQDGGDTILEEFIINFGRYPDDPEYYLDPKKYSNLQLKCTHSLTASATAGIATGKGKITIIARVIDVGAPPYKGFIMSKNVKSWTTAASGDVDIILARDYPYKALMVKDLLTTVKPDVSITNLKLSIDTDRIIPFDLRTIDILNDNLKDYGYGIQDAELLPDTTWSILGDLYRLVGVTVSEPGATAKAVPTIITAEKIVGTMTTGESGEVRIKTIGAAPHSCMFYPFGKAADVGDYLVSKGLGELKLIATQGGASAAASVVTQQLRV